MDLSCHIGIGWTALVAGALMSSLTANAQIPEPCIAVDKTYPGSSPFENSTMLGLVPGTANGALVQSRYYDSKASGSRPMTVRFDAQGVSSNSVKLPMVPDGFGQMAAMPDSGFLLASRYDSAAGLRRSTIIRTDRNGAHLWRKAYPAAFGLPYGFRALPQGGFFFLSDTMAAKLDGNGDTVFTWKRGDRTTILNVEPLTSGKIALQYGDMFGIAKVRILGADNVPGPEATLLRLPDDSEPDTLLAGSYQPYQADAGGFLFIGRTYMLRTDSAFRTLWSKPLPEPLASRISPLLVVRRKGSPERWMVAYQTATAVGLAQLDSMGTLLNLSSRPFGYRNGIPELSLHSLAETDGGHFWMGGIAYSGQEVNMDYVTKTSLWMRRYTWRQPGGACGETSIRNPGRRSLPDGFEIESWDGRNLLIDISDPARSLRVRIHDLAGRMLGERILPGMEPGRMVLDLSSIASLERGFYGVSVAAEGRVQSIRCLVR